MLKKIMAVILFPMMFGFAAIAENEDYILIDSGSCPSGYVESPNAMASTTTDDCPEGYAAVSGTTNETDDQGSFTYTCQ